MSKVKFIKWHPSVKDVPHVPDSRFDKIKWDEIRIYENDVEWLHTVNWLITFSFYVGIHWDIDDNLITIAVDNTWFRTR